MTKFIGALAQHFKATPILLTILMMNVLLAVMFAYTLHAASEAAARQAELLEKCLLRR